jgi:hypothetical protein
VAAPPSRDRRASCCWLSIGTLHPVRSELTLHHFATTSDFERLSGNTFRFPEILSVTARFPLPVTTEPGGTKVMECAESFRTRPRREPVFRSPSQEKPQRVFVKGVYPDNDRYGDVCRESLLHPEAQPHVGPLLTAAIHSHCGRLSSWLRIAAKRLSLPKEFPIPKMAPSDFASASTHQLRRSL